MTDPLHRDWQELAAGSVLHALSVEEEQRFAAHVAGCATCQVEVAALIETAVALGTAGGAQQPDSALRSRILEAADTPQPSPELRGRILAAAQEDQSGVGAEPTASPPATVPPADSPPATVTPIAARRPRRARVLAIAAGIAVLGLLGGAALATALQRGPTTPVAACARTADCRRVSLQDSGGRHVGDALLQGDHVVLVLDGLPANRTDQTYVLWQITQGGPVAMSGFDVAARTTVVDAGQMRAPVTATQAIALSREPGRTLPARPTAVVAQGQV